MQRITGQKTSGNILSAFKADINGVLPEKFKTIKKKIVQRCGEKNLQSSWGRLTEDFEKEIDFIKEKGSEVIPQVEYLQIVENNGKFPSTVADEIRKRGCVVIRNVVERIEALKYKEMVKQYISNHERKIAGFPGWEDSEYRKCYENILMGNWENHDAFDATHRLTANMDLYNCCGGCSMFRSFQGWLSLSTTKTGGGTLRLCPLVKHSASYVMLRPLLSDLLEESSMGGAIPGVQQHILENLHPHIIRAMVSIPDVNPGDCVFWHCDLVHAVEGICDSPTDSSVFYIPATPLCAKNAEYALIQRNAFEAGKSPPDFPQNQCEESFQDRATPDDLTELGMLTMGFKRIEYDRNWCNHHGAEEAIDRANEILELK